MRSGNVSWSLHQLWGLYNPRYTAKHVKNNQMPLTGQLWHGAWFTSVPDLNPPEVKQGGGLEGVGRG